MPTAFLDNDVATEIAENLSVAGYPTISSRALRRQRANDAQQFTYAAVNGRVLITHNGRDFKLLHQGWRLWKETWGLVASHHGIIELPQATVAELAANLLGPTQLAQLVIDLFATGSPTPDEYWAWRRAAGSVNEPALN